MQVDENSHIIYTEQAQKWTDVTEKAGQEILECVTFFGQAVY